VYARDKVRYLVLALSIGGCISAAPGEGLPAAARAAPAGWSGPIDSGKTQLLTVVSDYWGAYRATLRRYERFGGTRWTEVGVPVEVVLGHAGYGWGRGLHGNGAPQGRAGPIKREGDGRSPAGVFDLGPTYGYDPSSATPLAYVESTSALRCVDDPASPHYNRIVSTSEHAPDWQSAELMRREDDLYEIAIVIAHNAAPPTPGNGSCIFLHVWEGPDVAVRGCTAMAKPELQALSEWLEPGSAALVALPESEYDALQAAWSLPPRR
jgi:D-alanyl-D-alanine dipeptidase